MPCLRVANRVGVGAVVMACAFLVAVPSRASDPLQGILACRRIADSPSRLACFDRESARLANVGRAPLPASSEPSTLPPDAVVAGAPPARPAAAAAGAGLDPRQTFGIPPEKLLEREQAAQHLPRPLDHITARIQLVAKSADGRDIFTLDNQEVWAQLVPDTDLYVKPGDTVRISRAMLGSYWLALESRRGGCKVTRLR